MLGPDKTCAVTAGPARSRDADIYRRYAVALYRQALLTRGDPALAEHVAFDVIVNERALAAIPERDDDDARSESVLWRYRRAVSGPAARVARRLLRDEGHQWRETP